jgi:DNA modification methylase
MNPVPAYKAARVADLIPYARNSRTHSAEQIGKIAASIREFGFLNPVIVDGANGIIAGHGRILAAQKLGLEDVPTIEASHLSEAQRRAYIIADNRLALDAGWDDEMLRVELQDLQATGFDLALTGFDLSEIAALTLDATEGLTDPDAVPDAPAVPVTVLGDVWLLGRHRLMCGDSTSIDAVERLMDGQKAALLHADPPYGMGKEGEGVANDNLYQDKLDAFQIEWWTTFRRVLEDNASAYIWGNAPDLWRLWYNGGLSNSEPMTMRSQIIWDKPPSASPYGSPIGSDKMRSYPHGYEACLFFFVGEQGFNNNADNYWEGWEPIRVWLSDERKLSGLTTGQCNSICNKQNMSQSAFTKGGFRLILEEDYNALRNATSGRYFVRDYDELKRDYDELKREFYATRAYFDNAHDNMTDVWGFGRVTGEERHGHATPKPVEMMQRVMRSSLATGGLCVEPFGGSGSTLMGAEKTGRVCYSMELQPKYCDVIIQRWQNFTGQTATLEGGGQSYQKATEARSNAG